MQAFQQVVPAASLQQKLEDHRFQKNVKNFWFFLDLKFPKLPPQCLFEHPQMKLCTLHYVLGICCL